MVTSNNEKTQHNAVALSVDYITLTLFFIFIKFEVEIK